MKSEFRFFPYMYSYHETINSISKATNNNEIDEIIRLFIESVSNLYLKNDIIQKLYRQIEKEQLKENKAQSQIDKFNHALKIIENHKSNK